jgi:hypothetical protein
MTEPRSDESQRDPATGALTPAEFLQQANAACSTAAELVSFAVVTCSSDTPPAVIAAVVQQLEQLGVVGKLGPRTSLRVLDASKRSPRFGVVVCDREQHELARGLQATLPTGWTAALYALRAPTTIAQLRQDAEALLEVTLEQGLPLRTNQFAERGPPAAFRALQFRGTAQAIETHSIRGHALLFRFRDLQRADTWIRVHCDGDIEFDVHSAERSATRMVEPSTLAAIDQAWQQFMIDASLNLATSAAAGTGFEIAVCSHGTGGVACGYVDQPSASAHQLLAAIAAHVAQRAQR